MIMDNYNDGGLIKAVTEIFSKRKVLVFVLEYTIYIYIETYVEM